MLIVLLDIIRWKEPVNLFKGNIISGRIYSKLVWTERLFLCAKKRVSTVLLNTSFSYWTKSEQQLNTNVHCLLSSETNSRYRHNICTMRLLLLSIWAHLIVYNLTPDDALLLYSLACKPYRIFIIRSVSAPLCPINKLVFAVTFVSSASGLATVAASYIAANKSSCKSLVQAKFLLSLLAFLSFYVIPIPPVDSGALQLRRQADCRCFWKGTSVGEWKSSALSSTFVSSFNLVLLPSA